MIALLLSLLTSFSGHHAHVPHAMSLRAFAADTRRATPESLRAFAAGTKRHTQSAHALAG